MIFTATPHYWEKMLDQPLERRYGSAPADLVDFVAQCNVAAGNPLQARSVLEPVDFSLDIQQAIEELPLLVKEKLEPRLLGVFFMSGVGSSAITDVIAHANGDLIGAFVAIDIDIFLNRTANTWATWKESTPFAEFPGVHLQAFIANAADDNRKSGLQYLLLHEFGHVLTPANDFMPDWWLAASATKASSDYTFLPLSWQIKEGGEIVALPQEDFPLRQEVAYYAAPRLSASQMPALYRDLDKSGFPTLYAATCVYDDFAECFASYVHTVLLNKPYELHVYQDDRLVVQSGDFWKTRRSDAKAAFFQDFLAQPASSFARSLTAFREDQRCLDMVAQASAAFLGLAPFLRLSVAGVDLRLIAQALLEKAGEQEENANLWINLATAMFSINQRDVGLSIQEQALMMTRTYRLEAARQPAKFHLLVLMVAGDIAENTPIDCLLEDSAIALTFYYATAGAPLPAVVPAHDAVLVAISDSPANRRVLNVLEPLLQQWAKPVVNAPAQVPNTERGQASDLLQNVAGLLMPPTREVSRDNLLAIVRDPALLRVVYAGCQFPIILRPVGSQAGRDLAKINDAQEIVTYLSQVSAPAFYLSRFIDYSGEDGLFRKYRVALIAGQPFACHMAISSNWMIHYVNAGMYEDAAKRAEEQHFMVHFAEFARQHASALAAIAQRSKLDYVCIDCAETRQGELLIFEIDHTMVVHAMDPEDLFPYKKDHMLKVRQAFEDFLFRLPLSQPQPL